MKTLLAALFVLFTAVLGRGGPTEQVIIAAMKLGEQPNYSWNSTITDDARTYEVEGKTDRTGFTWLRMPMVKSIAQRLGRDAESDIEAIFNARSFAVIRTSEGWRTLRELPGYWGGGYVDPFPVLPSGRIAVLPADPEDAADPFALPPMRSLRVSDVAAWPHSHAHFGLSRPQDDLAIIVSSFVDLRIEGALVTGTLTDLGAQLLLVRDGPDDIQPLAAAGAFRFLIEDGMVVRYQLRLEGVLLLDQARKVRVRQASTTRVKAIGTTHFEVPEEARRRLVVAVR